MVKFWCYIRIVVVIVTVAVVVVNNNKIVIVLVMIFGLLLLLLLIIAVAPWILEIFTSEFEHVLFLYGSRVINSVVDRVGCCFVS